MKRTSSSSESEAPRKRGRPIEFDRKSALDAALATFWLRGYSGASLDHLTTAMDINKPSLYATFGNKEQLYEAAIDHYVANIGASYLAPLAAPSIRAALDGFFEAMIKGVTGSYGPRGCIVACTLPAEAGASTPAREKLAAVLAHLDAALVARIRAAQSAGEIANGRDAKAVGQLITSGMLALSVRARAGASRKTLHAIAAEFVSAALAP
jgi:TetR/AcrR family transcriptional regulator, copper-responsive repressor